MSSCIVCGGTGREELVLNDLPLLKCRGCGLMRRAVFDVPIEYYEDLDAGDTPEKRAARFRNSLDRIRTLARFVPLSSWCDVGTGEGLFLEALAQAGGDGVGIEPSEESCVTAERHGVTIAGHVIEDAPRVMAEQGVRVASLFHVIEHLEHPEVEMKCVYDALPPGGFLVIETPDIDSSVFKRRRYEDPLIYPEHLWYFSETTLRALLEREGFRIVASGRRDFDQYNLPIRESLFRLGLSAQNPTRRPRSSARPVQDGPRQEGARESWVRVLARRVLSRLVVMTGRLQYVWVVAQKPGSEAEMNHEDRV